MGVIEFELTRTVDAGIEDVFARLADIDGHNDWMPDKGSMLRHTRQTSPGPPTRGTTYLDETSFGPTPGEIAKYEPPHTLVYHWWDRSKAGKLKLEGWPAYSLEKVDDGTTLVRHTARMQTYGLYRLAAPLLRRIAIKERSATLEALAASFDRGQQTEP
ncbi:SRPBCC family protein [Micromonospora sp. DT81.3]|uniref:SRPBCC family protein n=1 Tax=Micromonospora sp. DT81.3 TaxID=3416523 RepID=UPI003CE6D8AB